MSAEEKKRRNPDIKGDKIAISVKNASKKFCKGLRRNMAYGIMDLSKNLFGIKQNSGTLRKDEFWALEDINFKLKRGETIGLIGRNGSGKTTLLRLLAGIFPPDKGKIIIKGRIGALIAVGAGFHPHMTGRENIYLNGAILGISCSEIRSQFDDIVSFAEIESFLDAPVSTYSSGMKVRLGFAISTAIQPDILLLDEILSVGDAKFRNKCYKRIGALKKNCATILISHSMEQILQNCSRCIVLEKGLIIFEGPTDKSIGLYQKINEIEHDQESFESFSHPIENYKIELSSMELEYGEKSVLILSLISSLDIQNITIWMMVYNSNGLLIAEWNSKRKGLHYSLKQGENIFKIEVGPMIFKKDEYPIGLIVTEDIGNTPLVWSYKKCVIKLNAWTNLGAQVIF